VEPNTALLKLQWVRPESFFTDTADVKGFCTPLAGLLPTQLKPRVDTRKGRNYINNINNINNITKMPRGPELHPTDRARILELHSIGWGAKRIHTKHPEWKIGTIKYTIRKEQQRGQHCASQPRSGRPRTLTAEERDKVYDIVMHQNPNISIPELLAEVDHKVKKRSLQYLLRELGKGNG
jgi:hypothetical protein